MFKSLFNFIRLVTEGEVVAFFRVCKRSSRVSQRLWRSVLNTNSDDVLLSVNCAPFHDCSFV